jgi:Spy/CpxP family protein refolding chaperone
VAALLATFAAGVAAGVGVDQWRHHARDRERHGGGPLPMSDRFLVPLHLTAAQRASVDSILTRRRAQLEKFWAGPGQQLRLVVDSTRNEVRAVLTPAQRATYDSLMAARRPRGGDRGGPPGMGGPPPGTPSGPAAHD